MEDERTAILSKTHIENRDLFRMAFGRVRFKEWEEDHLHECEVCQGILYVLLSNGERCIMQRFQPGDKVFIIPKFSHLYGHHSGVVINVKVNPFRPAFNEYTLEFEDRSTAKLFEFQIIEDLPQYETVIAELTFDSERDMTTSQTRGQPSGRQIILQTTSFHLDVRIRTTKLHGSIIGQILERNTRDHLNDVDVRLMREAMLIGRTISDSFGVFEFIDTPRGSLNILATLPQHSLRILAPFSI